MNVTPGYPRRNPCLSFWLQHTRNSLLQEHRTTETLPGKADVTIIGSGLSGAATAYFLLTTGPEDKRPKSVVLLEAREACDGATARNGGHCRPDCYRDYRHYKANFGQEQAFKIIQNEMDTLNLTEEIIAKEGIDCDFWRDVAMDQRIADALAASYAEFAADGGPVEGIVMPILDPAQAREETRCPSATVAYKSPSSSLFPRKLVLHLLTLCIEKYGMNLQTHTPVRRVVSGAGIRWRVETDRGVVETEKVVYATNAFTATLLPEFLGHIYPFKGQCSAVVPPKAYAGKEMFRQTYGLAYSDYHRRDMQAYGDNKLKAPATMADYLIQRPDGIVIFGGQRGSVPVERLLGNTDDTHADPERTAALREALPRHFEGWPKEDLAEGEGLVHAWTGIMGYTTDGFPYVGELQDKPGAFICAGHHGHGMARIMTCARGLAALIQGGSWESTGLPECFQPRSNRLGHASV
ncbi:Fad dependent oxidoreductase [Mycena sanguinolenta]|uniref:Fad dependent oxidoreductase n=1 Tax=Mycena sanguinolenta TaxID=230812 RepID=A0A8H7DMM0_9AGAR|nr:Fad dependent oxidoreductase [Mycena sanguinolenta]